MNEVEGFDETHAEDFRAMLDVLVGASTPGQIVGLDDGDLTRIAQLGIASFAAARYDRAREVFELLATFEPNLYLSHQYLGMIAEQASELELAAFHYSEACARLDPNEA